MRLRGYSWESREVRKSERQGSPEDGSWEELAGRECVGGSKKQEIRILKIEY